MIAFNRNPRRILGSIEQPSQELVRNTLGLVNASVEDAIRYGGELTRAAISAMHLRNDRKNIIVDVKVHMLMPGFFAAIPGWHTDGVPRGESLNPLAKAPPNLEAQVAIENWRTAVQPGRELRPTHYHMLVTGSGCLTEFLESPFDLDETAPSTRGPLLYAGMNEQVNAALKSTPVRHVQSVPSCAVVEFDWWDIHRGVEATQHEWRYFIRVAELDLAEPERDLRKVIRTQQQVYAPQNFGW